MLLPLMVSSLCGFLLAVPAIPQKKAEPSKEQELPQFTGGVTEVVVPVTVTDEKGKFVSNLEARDFRILDEGRAQRLTFFSHSEKQPIVVGFLVDQSNTMRIHWTKYQDSILELIWALIPGDPQYSGY